MTGIKFPNPDGQEQGIALYRSRPIEKGNINNRDITKKDKDLDYRLVAIYPPPIDLPNPLAQPPEREATARIDDDMPEEIRAEQQSLRFDNDRLPATVKQFTTYNDRIYAPNINELRYSDVRFGNLAHWAYPKTNAIRRPVDFLFATSYRDILYFGGRKGLWSLTGIAGYNHDIDRISTIGAIDAYSITTTQDVFAFISTAGLHVATGTGTQDISEPLQAHFENQEPVRGSIIFLPNSHTLFHVIYQRLDGSLNRQSFLSARQWQQWNDIEVEQTAQLEQISTTGDTTTETLIVENSKYIRTILWENLTSAVDSKDTINTDSLIPISWSWKSQKLDFDREGIATERKRFTELIIEGKADTEIDGEPPNLNITFYIYDTKNNITEKTLQRNLNRPHLYKTRVPIRKICLLYTSPSPRDS